MWSFKRKRNDQLTLIVIDALNAPLFERAALFFRLPIVTK